MIAMLAASTGIPPSVLWAEQPEDLATLVDVLAEQADQMRTKRRR